MYHKYIFKYYLRNNFLTFEKSLAYPTKYNKIRSDHILRTTYPINFSIDSQKNIQNSKKNIIFLKNTINKKYLYKKH
jgi:hypothetical protein